MIHHAFDGAVTVTDDADPARAPLVIPPDATDRDAQIRRYLKAARPGWWARLGRLLRAR